MKKDLRAYCDQHINQMAQRDFIHGDRLKFTWKLFLSGDKNIRWVEMWSFVVLNYWMEKNGVQ
jgi:asparagine synthase (glutamine-hydrolysing)